MYCHYILADYITLVAAPLAVGGSDMGSSGHGQSVHLLPGAAAALKPGACALYGACSPAQVCRQASHMGPINTQGIRGLRVLPSITGTLVAYCLIKEASEALGGAKAFVHLQVQHVYTVLQTTGGGTRRAAMAELRQTYESTLKFSGKV